MLQWFLFFWFVGLVFWRLVFVLPLAGRSCRGYGVIFVLYLAAVVKLTSVMAVAAFEPGNHILLSTRNGLVKKTDLMAFSRPRLGGIIAITLLTGDELIEARLTDGTYNVFLVSAMGKSIRFHEAEVRPSGRTSQGVRGMRLTKGDCIVGMAVLSHGQTLFTLTENGYGKRTSVDEYPIQKRGGKGVITIKTSERNGKVVALLLVEEDDNVMLMTDAGKLIRIPVNGVSVISLSLIHI